MQQVVGGSGVPNTYFFMLFVFGTRDALCVFYESTHGKWMVENIATALKGIQEKCVPLATGGRKFVFLESLRAYQNGHTV
jgi:hypothetical protein